MYNVTAKKKFIVLALLSCFLIVSLLSSTFILTHADHQHDQNGANGSCATCAQLQSAGNTLKQLTTAFVGALLAITGILAAIGALKTIIIPVITSTPVTLKIKMNN